MTLILPARQKAARAFTLLEVIIGMSILGILAGSIFGFLYQTGATAGEIREVDQRDEEVSRFIELLRATIEQMPPEGRIQIIPPSASDSEFYEITIVDAVTAFSFGERGVGEGDTVIGLRPQPPETIRPDLEIESGQQVFQIAISREDFAPQDEDGDGMVFNQSTDGNGFLQVDNDGRYWLPVLDNVTALMFRFWDEEQHDWLTDWEETDVMPPLLEIAMTDPYRPLPLRVVFDVPDHLTEPDTGAGDSADQQDQGPTSSGSTTRSTTTVAPTRGGPPVAEKADRKVVVAKAVTVVVGAGKVAIFEAAEKAEAHQEDHLAVETHHEAVLRKEAAIEK